MTGSTVGRYSHGRYSQAPADCFCDLSNRHTLFCPWSVFYTTFSWFEHADPAVNVALRGNGQAAHFG